MKFFIVTILFAFAIGGDTTCITIRRLNYETEVLKTDLVSLYPQSIAIDHNTNTLFFSYKAPDEMYKSAYLSLKTGAYGLVSGIQGSFAHAVNRKDNTVYMAGADDIYKYDYNTKTATRLNIMDSNSMAWQMFYKDGLYFAAYPQAIAYLYKNAQVVEVPELKNVQVMQLAVTSDNNLVYYNSSGLFMYNRAQNETIFLNNTSVNGMTSDIEGHIYFIAFDGIYYVNEETKQVEYLAKLFNTNAFAIESNGNFIYTSGSSIFRLKPTTRVCRDEN